MCCRPAFLRRAGSLIAFALFVVVSARPTEAQDIFHSTQSANLQTTSGLGGGSFLFEISHRFLPPISDGSDELWGLDGPVYNRFAFSYVPADGIMLAVQRSNFEDNFELNGKARLLRTSLGTTRAEAAVMLGAAWNMDPILVEGAEDDEMQFYAQGIVDVLLGDRVAVGVVPTWIRNPRIRDFESFDAVSVGVHGQVYLTGSVSLLAEWIFSEEQQDLEHDSGTFGVEFETRGHFFKLLATNQVRMNPTQFLPGSAVKFGVDELRLGFNITRVLPF